MKSTALIKVNLPLTEEDYRNGNGEGVWVEVDMATKAAYDEDKAGLVCRGVLANSSLYYPTLQCGCEIVFEMRGEHRPVADYHGFLAGKEKLTSEEKEGLLRSIAAMR